MASATNLLGLVTQLQNLEVSFSKILMETAMKLSALTDLNVFVLIETQEGRRFAGKRHLCDAFVDGSLHLQGNDVEFEINPSVFALRQRYHHRSPPRKPGAHSRRSSSGSSSGHHATPQRSPKRAGGSPGGHSPSKRRRCHVSAALADLSLVNGGTSLSDISIHPDAVPFPHDDGGGSVERNEETGLKLDPETWTDAEAETTDAQLDEQTGEMRTSTALVPFNGDASEGADVSTTNGVVGHSAASPGRGGRNRGGGGIFDQNSRSLVELDIEDCEELNRQLMDSLPRTLCSKLDGLSQFQSGPDLIPGSTEFRLLNR